MRNYLKLGLVIIRTKEFVKGTIVIISYNCIQGSSLFVYDRLLNLLPILRFYDVGRAAYRYQ